ncbi:hypothetical protein GCM10010195_41620 [Kitasatospora griseola]|nr:hypothetical protein GCM10010195_41620 [Kitasatospora griseola]
MAQLTAFSAAEQLTALSGRISTIAATASAVVRLMLSGCCIGESSRRVCGLTANVKGLPACLYSTRGPVLRF